MKKVFIFFFKIIKFYQKKRLKILIHEIYFGIKYFKGGNLIKFRNSVFEKSGSCNGQIYSFHAAFHYFVWGRGGGVTQRVGKFARSLPGHLCKELPMLRFHLAAVL